MELYEKVYKKYVLGNSWNGSFKSWLEVASFQGDLYNMHNVTIQPGVL
jgi:hypothetical protein